MTRTLAGLGFVGLLATAALAQQAGPVIDVRGAGGPSVTTFEGQWRSIVQAEQAGNTQKAAELAESLRRMRMERNVAGVEVVARALVTRGLQRLEGGEIESAEADFAQAVALDARVPEGHLGLALAKIKSSPTKAVSAARDVARAATARLATSRGRANMVTLAVLAGSVTLFVSLTVFALCMLLRHGALFRHDLEEKLGSEGRRPLALGLLVVLLLLPVLALQGPGWLPLWWLALLFAYMSTGERVAASLLLLLVLAVGPVAALVQAQIQAWANPLYRAALSVIEDGGDGRAIALFERAAREHADDPDLAYLLASAYRKGGRADDAIAIYRRILDANPRDALALNNLGNVEFANAEFLSAIARYHSALESASEQFTRATLYYNLHLAHLQRFEYQAAQDARRQAEQVDRGVVADYEGRWRVEKDGSKLAAVVDLGMTAEECLAKFAGAADGAGRKARTLSGASPVDYLTLGKGLLNRLAAAVGLVALFAFVRGRWRGSKAFTMRCLKCGTPFCRECHLGAAVAGLCTQCYHLFIVRDGVSGPARNQKLREVQTEDERRERVFRTLSLVSPGAGHLYGQRTWSGLLIVALWYALIVTTVMAGRIVPVSEVPMRWVGPWPVVVSVVLLLVLYIVANRARPDFEIVMPVRRGAPRARGRQA